MAKFNLITNISNGAGLQKDAELLRSLLESFGHSATLTMFNEVNPTFREHDVNLFLEVLDARWLPYGKLNWYMPNSEWYFNCWDSLLPRLDRIFCKTQDCLHIWQQKVLANKCIFIGFESRDFHIPEIEKKSAFLHLAGKSGTKNSAAVAGAWRNYKLPYPLIVTAANPDIARLFAGIPNVELHDRLSDADTERLLNQCRFHIMPSSYEGWGHVIHEALGCGGIVLTTDAPPMRDFGGIPKDLLIPVYSKKPLRAATEYIIDPISVVDRVKRAVSLPSETLDRLSREARDAFIAQRTAFREKLKLHAHFVHFVKHADPIVQPTAVSKPVETAPQGPQRDIVIIPTFYRPAFLTLCLEHLAACPESAEKEFWVMHDQNKTARGISLTVDETAAVVKQFSDRLRIKFTVRPPHSYDGNSYNVMAAYKQAYESGAQRVYLVEDDVLVTPDFFRWHDAMLAANDVYCSVAWHCLRRADIPRDDDPLGYFISHEDYASIGVCWPRESLRDVIKHANSEYYRNQHGYVRANFPGNRFADAFTEQDGVIMRLMDYTSKPVAWPVLRRCSHIGWYGYHRALGRRLAGNLPVRIQQLREIVYDAEKLKAYSNTNFEDVEIALKESQQWEAKDLKLIGKLASMRLELGCGNKPTAGFTHHDCWKHSPHVDVAFDLEKLPWPLEDNSVSEIRAFDVFEHLRLDVREWLDEAWRVLRPSGKLTMRLPAWDNPYSWRDPTHRRVFHPETFLYWCPTAAGTVWQDFGRYYWGQDYNKWWNQIEVKRDCGDLVYTLQKRV